MDRAELEVSAAASEKSASLRRPVPWSAAEMATPEGLVREQTITNMVTSDPPRVTRNVVLVPLSESLTRTVYALKPEVLRVALKHYPQSTVAGY